MSTTMTTDSIPIAKDRTGDYNPLPALTGTVIGPERNELYAALAAAQGMMGAAVANRENKHFKFKYADLAACLDAVREPLSKNGLALIQLPQPIIEGECSLSVILAHKSGQSLETTLTMRPKDQTPQGIGSCLTYMRRYTLCAVCGIAQEDDDGNKASEEPAAETLTSKQIDNLMELSDELFGAEANEVLLTMANKLFGVENITQVETQYFKNAVSALKKKHKREQPKLSQSDKDTAVERGKHHAESEDESL